MRACGWKKIPTTTGCYKPSTFPLALLAPGQAQGMRLAEIHASAF